ncbi:MAG: response regulator [Bdellovibrionales bacterium]|nr:response regulator [Bdellovibrionales bacterium]
MTEKQEDLVAQYLSASDVLIVDEGMSARVGLKKALVDMGAALEKIHLASTLEEAEETIRQKRPRVVFCDFEIRGKSGLALLQKQRSERASESRECLFVIVASNTSQSAVAQAAEEDIDAYLLKPYTLAGLNQSVRRAVTLKVKPPEYLQLIESGKRQLDAGDIPHALEDFHRAMTMDAKPALACFYEGLAHFRASLLDGSEFSYKKGLTFNTIHYKCLVGLFDLLMSTKKFPDAYEVVKRISKFFPANPERLSAVLWLAVQTGHYAEVEKFYQDFVAMDRRNEELIRCICAALLVCAKHFFLQGDPAHGASMAQKAALAAAGRAYFLRKGVEVLLEGGCLREAKEVLKRFTQTDGAHFAVASFLVAAKEEPWTAVVERGTKLLDQGVRDQEVRQVLIPLLREHGMERRAEDLEAEARGGADGRKAA